MNQRRNRIISAILILAILVTGNAYLNVAEGSVAKGEIFGAFTEIAQSTRITDFVAIYNANLVLTLETTGIDTCAELAAIMTGETGTCGSLVFSVSPTFTGTVGFAALTGTNGTITNLVSTLATSTSATTTNLHVSGTFSSWGASSSISLLTVGLGTSTRATTTNLYVSGFMHSDGTLDFSGASTFQIPSSASSTITAAQTGACELDTTDTALHCLFGSSVRPIPAESIWGFALASTTAAEDLAIPVTKSQAFIVTKVAAKNAMLSSHSTATTTGVTFNLAHGTNKGTRANLFSSDVNTTLVTSGTSTYTTFCASGCSVTVTFGDETVAANEEWWATTSAASSTLHALTIQVFGYYAP